MDSRPLNQDEYYQQLVARNTGRRDGLRYRNTLLLHLATLVGLRESELTQATIGLFVSPTGDLQEFVILPDSITWDGYERPVLLTHPEVKAAFEAYLQWLIESGINTQPGNSHFGLNPNTPLLVSDSGKPYTMQSRGDRLSPAAMHRQLDGMIKAADLWDAGVRRKSLMRTYVIFGYRAGLSVNDLMITTGLSESSIQQILVMDLAQYDQIAEWWTTQRERRIKRQEAFARRRKWMI
ncbi:integrase [Ferrimonas aestuarii]|uniref:Integrase n=1 Tax=Ferrimonas aestuarii TaxID=2569539 RepID=A0A4U1BQB8_9GAMM|nr:integrase [Ferrimonas aestuarii]TKB53313.1 integrase [Ferrimonas aestuarii]